MKYLLFLVLAASLCSCAPSFHSDMLKATDQSPVPDLPALHTDASPDVKITHDALLLNGKQSNRAKEKVEILLQNEMKELLPPGDAFGSYAPEVDLDFKYMGYGWTVLSGMSFMSLNILGMPFLSWQIDAHLNVKVRDATGMTVWEHDYFQSQKHNMGLYYNYSNSEHLEGAALTLVRGMLEQARTDMHTDQGSITQSLDAGKQRQIAAAHPPVTEAVDDGAQLLFSRTPQAHEVHVIAVIPVTGEDCKGKPQAGDDLAIYSETALLGTYSVVDRKFIEDTLKEIQLGMTGITFEDNVLQAGCIANADGYLFVEHGCLMDEETINAKLIHCETSQIVWNCVSSGHTASKTFETIVDRLQQE